MKTQRDSRCDLSPYSPSKPSTARRLPPCFVRNLVRNTLATVKRATHREDLPWNALHAVAGSDLRNTALVLYWIVGQ